MFIQGVHDNPVNILHFPGKQKKTNWEMINYLKELPVHLPSNISIISIMTPNYIPSSPLHYQLTASNIHYINTTERTNKMWVNRQKPQYIVEALKQVKTEYCLILDGADVVIVDDLSDIIWKFNSYDRDILFNATSNRFPDMPIESVDGWDDYRERPLLFGPFCYLNAGCCLGKTKALKWFYKEVAEHANQSNVPSEQYHVRAVMAKHQDKVFFDYDCRIFQAFNKGMSLLTPAEHEKVQKEIDLKIKQEEEQKSQAENTGNTSVETTEITEEEAQAISKAADRDHPVSSLLSE